jgi:gliding motility-associated-like protein
MTIYDRWGEKIFETDNTSLPWDGHVSGSDKVAEAGVYVYRVKFNDSRYTNSVIVGSVTLVR